MTQLAYLQVLQGTKFKAEVNRNDTTVVSGNVQRGMIYDSTGKVLVGNSAHQAITYTKSVNELSSDIYQTATSLGKYVKVPTDSLTDRQLADYYLANNDNLKDVLAKIPNSAQYSSDARYDKALEYVQSHNLHFTTAEKNAAEIYAKMSGAYQLSTINIKNSGVTSGEIARVGEHLSELQGINIGTSWSRNYPDGQSIQGLTGTVSTEKAGLPADEVNQLLAKGYSRNDQVGQSYLEQKYEPVLSGSKSQTQVYLNSQNKITKEVKKYGGQKGDNLQLTINANFQKKLSALVKSAEEGAGGYSTGTYAVVMNPKNGAIYGMAGVDRNPETQKSQVTI
ncbi:cell division protein FtsI [Lentilactobacillus kosonis]|uniref:Cell division protein FtsI n=1 Tax=Lentilactobacillus kosonis TaxID=2810561 RepID=A0A401FKF5_9LACO|nr:cell division protein FtsI [Lentilactobacillus kosonis]